jgi:putative transposase
MCPRFDPQSGAVTTQALLSGIAEKAGGGLRFPTAHWKHLRTTNPIESPFAAVRLRTTAAKRFKRVENAAAVIWKTLLIAERTFRRLDAPERLAEVAEGVTYVNGCA